MNRKAKKTYFANNIHPKCFWKAVKPYFNSGNIFCKERILLVENERVVANDDDISTIFNVYFNGITDNLAIPMIPGNLSSNCDLVSKFNSHPSILNIRARFNYNSFFEICKVTRETVVQEILSLDSGKKVSGSIPVKMLQLAVKECADVITKIFNTCIVDQLYFPDELKLADIVPIYKKGSPTDKANYRPITKAFDCLPHELLIAKMAAYGFGERTLKLFLSYLSNRKHRVRIGSSVSEILVIFLGVPCTSVILTLQASLVAWRGISMLSETGSRTMV